MTDTMFPDEFEFPVLSDELIHVYADWYQWVVNGAPEHNKFSAHLGLCYALRRCERYLRHENREALFSMAVKMRLNPEYPFGGSEFNIRNVYETQHLDPNRLAWVEGCLQAAAV